MTWKKKILIGFLAALAVLTALYFYGRSIAGVFQKPPVDNQEKTNQPPLCIKSPDAQESQNIHYCPEHTQLFQDKKTRKWYAPNNWASKDISASSKVIRFKRAEWSGIADRGVVSCVYESASANFPVVIFQQKLTLKPSQARWGNIKTVQSKVLGCGALNYDVCECGFSYAPDPSQADETIQTSFKWVPARGPDDLMSPFTCIIAKDGENNCY